MLAHVFPQMLRLHGAKLLLRAQNRQGQRVLPVGRLRYEIMHHIIRRIFVHGDFFHDHVFLFPQLFRIEQGTEKHIRQYVDRDR
ncbi:hypothetical protein D3C76_1565650 [compost metagenome]